MKGFTKLLNRLRGLTNAIARYPLTTAFLVAAAVIFAISISTEKEHMKLLLTCAVGAVLSASLQAAYERFLIKIITRLILMIFGIVLTAGYYLILRTAPALSMEIGVRTSAALLALFFAFIWVPVIKSKISFNESFMAVFKSFFHSLFFAAVLFDGCSLIIAAIDTLIVNVSEKAYSYTADIVFVLFATIYFLSLIPQYPGKRDKDIDPEKAVQRDEAINKATFCPKFLEVLISYIIIPLTMVFTVILVLYIVLNIRGEFWTNNLLEPMLVSYSITVILVYVLSSRLENKFAVFFRKVFPKVLVPIVLFQIAASALSLPDTGITHTRYYVILYGVFAACAGVVMSLVPVRKNGIIAAMLIAFSLISIIPPVDAFTVSRVSQENMLKTALVQNGMLENNTITPNASIPDADKSKIVLSAQYLYRMGYADQIAWLPEDFNAYEDFYDTFGFNDYDVTENVEKSTNVFLNDTTSIDIKGYDVLAHSYFNTVDAEQQPCTITNDGNNYVLTKDISDTQNDIVLLDENNQEIMRFDFDQVFSRYNGFASDKSEMSVDEATFSTENDSVVMTIIVQNAATNTSIYETDNYADFYVLIQFK